MKEKINVKGTVDRKMRMDEFMYRIKAYPILESFINLPESSGNSDSENSEYNMEKVRLWILILQFMSAVTMRNQTVLNEIRDEILKNKIMQEPCTQQFNEYLLNSEYSIDSIWKYVQEIFMFD